MMSDASPPSYHGHFMRIFPAVCLALVLVGACKKKPDFTLKVLIGGTTVTAPGAAPLEDSVVIVEKGKIREVGPRKDIPVPQASDRTDLTGEWIVPAPGSRIEPGEPANILILRHAPNGVTPANPADIGATLEAGEWKMPGR